MRTQREGTLCRSWIKLEPQLWAALASAPAPLARSTFYVHPQLDSSATGASSPPPPGPGISATRREQSSC